MPLAMQTSFRLEGDDDDSASSSSSSSCSYILDFEEIASRVEAMRHRESSTYLAEDYLERIVPPTSPTNDTRKKPANRVCREKMSEWCYQVVDFCEYQRETVEMAMSYLDRFLSTDSGAYYLQDRKDFQLASMTALYMAVKLVEPAVMDPALVASLGRGSCTEDEITETEMKMLTALRWNVQPPTSHALIQHFLALLNPEAVSASVRTQLHDVARYQAELAVNCYSFVTVRPSVIAYAAMLNATQTVSDADLPAWTRAEFLRNLQSVVVMDDADCKDSAHLCDVQSRLLEVFAKNNSGVELPIVNTVRVLAPSPTQTVHLKRAESCRQVSPRCVAQEGALTRCLSQQPIRNGGNAF